MKYSEIEAAVQAQDSEVIAYKTLAKMLQRVYAIITRECRPNEEITINLSQDFKSIIQAIKNEWKNRTLSNNRYNDDIINIFIGEIYSSLVRTQRKFVKKSRADVSENYMTLRREFKNEVSLISSDQTAVAIEEEFSVTLNTSDKKIISNKVSFIVDLIFSSFDQYFIENYSFNYSRRKNSEGVNKRFTEEDRLPIDIALSFLIYIKSPYTWINDYEAAVVARRIDYQKLVSISYEKLSEYFEEIQVDIRSKNVLSTREETESWPEFQVPRKFKYINGGNDRTCDFDEMSNFIIKSLNNIFLYGEPGCGKTSVVEEILQRVVSNNISGPNIRFPFYFDISLISSSGISIGTKYALSSWFGAFFRFFIFKDSRPNFVHIDRRLLIDIIVSQSFVIIFDNISKISSYENRKLIFSQIMKFASDFPNAQIAILIDEDDYTDFRLHSDSELPKSIVSSKFIGFQVCPLDNDDLKFFSNRFVSCYRQYFATTPFFVGIRNEKDITDRVSILVDDYIMQTQMGNIIRVPFHLMTLIHILAHQDQNLFTRYGILSFFIEKLLTIDEKILMQSGYNIEKYYIALLKRVDVQQILEAMAYNRYRPPAQNSGREYINDFFSRDDFVDLITSKIARSVDERSPQTLRNHINQIVIDRSPFFSGSSYTDGAQKGRIRFSSLLIFHYFLARYYVENTRNEEIEVVITQIIIKRYPDALIEFLFCAMAELRKNPKNIHNFICKAISAAQSVESTNFERSLFLIQHLIPYFRSNRRIEPESYKFFARFIVESVERCHQRNINHLWRGETGKVIKRWFPEVLKDCDIVLRENIKNILLSTRADLEHDEKFDYNFLFEDVRT